MKVYLLQDHDFAKLLAEISRNPEHGTSGGSSQVLSDVEKEAFRKTHRFYRYVIREWMDGVMDVGKPDIRT